MDFMASVLGKLTGGLFDPLAYLKLGENFHSLRKKMEDLKIVRDDVKTRVEDEEERQFLTRTNQVQGWLQQVADIEEEVKKIEADFDHRWRFLNNYHPICWSSYKLAERVAKTLRDIAELKNKASFETVTRRSRPAAVEAIPGIRHVGMDLTLGKAMNFLRDDGVGILGIYGMGGVGKTSLMKEINNAFGEQIGCFDSVIWVVVSKNSSLERIQKDIGDRLHLSLPETFESKATHLLKVLKRKNYLLLLDDVWERLDLDAIGIPSPKKYKFKIAFTTRSLDVCSDMGADKAMKVDCLQEDDAWILFRMYVGGEGVVESPLIQPIAKNIAGKCRGLPLALITIGRAMANKMTVEEWKKAETTLRKSPSELRGVEHDILYILKFSYDNLPDDVVKSCFVYCSLFPEDLNVQTTVLINYWIGEGFLDKYDDIYKARNKGYDIIGTLKVACLFENELSEKQIVKMHDKIRELALWIARECGKKEDKFLVEAGVGLTEAPRVNRWKDAERISLMHNNINALTETPACPILSTLIIRSNSKLNSICNGFFQSMTLLRVLDLSFTNLHKLPSEIGNLVQLVYLNLSNTNITMLPEEIRSLVKLKHLDLHTTNFLKANPLTVIKGNLCLNVLNLCGSNYCDWDEDGLAELEGLSRLNALGITIKTDSTFRRFFQSPILPQHTHWLYIWKCNGLTSIHLSSNQRMKYLQELSLEKCNELKELKLSEEVDGEFFLSSLEFLWLFQLPKLKVIVMPPPGCLQNLRSLQITGCHKLKNITWVLHLDSLETLFLSECNGMEEIISATSEVEEEDMTALPQLRSIDIEELPELRSICCRPLSFPCLTELTVFNCPKLRKLPLKHHSASKTLQMIRGYKKWWNRLKWEDDTIKSSFLPCFREVEDEENKSKIGDEDDDDEDDDDDDDAEEEDADEDEDDEQGRNKRRRI